MKNIYEFKFVDKHANITNFSRIFALRFYLWYLESVLWTSFTYNTWIWTIYKHKQKTILNEFESTNYLVSQDVISSIFLLMKIFVMLCIFIWLKKNHLYITSYDRNVSRYSSENWLRIWVMVMRRMIIFIIISNISDYRYVAQTQHRWECLWCIGRRTRRAIMRPLPPPISHTPTLE